MHEPSQIHLKAAKRVLRYVKGTTYGIMFNRIEKLEMVGYTNSNWGGTQDEMKSTSRVCVHLGIKCV
uniref:Retrovirus-related Pol polyprotein from transposon TNT 1-94 n=1 Tax=Rhizophora mucronata TaxID=61149 RepID=A0A2P2Q5G6_RHIMU